MCWEAFHTARPTITNCILWGNTATTGPQIHNVDSEPQVTFSDVQGGCDTTGDAPCTIDDSGNFDADPRFSSDQDDLTLAPDSPCVDTGSMAGFSALDAADLDGDGDTTERVPLDGAGNARVQGSSIDLGAYEAAGETPSVPDCPIHVKLNGDDATTGESWGTERKLDILIETACPAILREQALPDSVLARVD